MTEEKSLAEIGEYVKNVSVGAMMQCMLSGLTKEDLDRFDRYLNSQETMMPIFDPTSYIRMGRDGIPAAKRRLHVTREILKLLEAEMPEMLKAVKP